DGDHTNARRRLRANAFHSRTEEQEWRALPRGNRWKHSRAGKHLREISDRSGQAFWRVAVVSGQPQASRSSKSQHRLHNPARAAVEDADRSRLRRAAWPRAVSKLQPEL